MTDFLDERSGSSSPFPWIDLVGGTAGGYYNIPDKTPNEVSAFLPDGKSAIPCVILGYRSRVVLFPFGFDDRKDSDKPLMTGAAPSFAVNPSLAKKIAKAVLRKVLTTARPNVVDMERGSVGSAYASRHAPRPHWAGSKRPWV